MTSYAGFLAQGIHNIKKYGQYIPYIRNVIVQIDAIASAMNRALRVLSAVEVGSRSAYAHALAASQEAMWLTTSGYFLSQVTNEVMRKSDEHFHAYLLRGTTAERLSRRYEGKGRSRLQDMVNRSLDGYSKNRSFDLKLPGLRTWISMRGQTEMIRDHDTSELERWQAYDTMSIHHKRLFRKRRHEMPLAWSGVELARRSEGGMDRLNNRADHNKTDNAKAYQNIHDRSFWSTIAYLGLPTVRDLDEGSTAFRQNHRFPADRITVVGVVKKRNDINTARQIGLGSGRLMLEDSLPDFRQDAVMMAMSAAEIYFRHPPGADERIEYASMYSPYWQVRLAGVQAQERLLAGASASLGRSS
ncbi:MAG: hypothetical protein Q4B13_07900 [Lautropia sp.]|nr:hypothetical protein [Lautropia sp.]